MNPCHLCQVIAHEIHPPFEVLFEDDHVLIYLDANWEVKGHTNVAWKTHVVNISDLTEEEYLALSKYVYHTEKILLDQLTLDKSWILKSGGLCPHLHFHIYPIPSDKPFAQIVDMLTTKERYAPSIGEQETFVAELRARLQKELG